MEIAAIITAVSVLLTAMVTGFIQIRHEVRSVHRIVNQQRTDMIEEIKTLRAIMRQDIS
jgi:hypothetical protein